MSVFFGYTVPRIVDELGEPDETVTVILKGHLLTEEHLNRILSLQLLYPGELDRSRFSFSQRLCLVRALEPTQHAIWNLVGEVNSLRNQLAHSLARDQRARRIGRFLEHYVTLDPNPESADIVRSMSEASAVSRAIGFCLGFLAAYEEAIMQGVPGTMRAATPPNPAAPADG